MSTIDRQTAAFWRSVLYTILATVIAIALSVVSLTYGEPVLRTWVWFFAFMFAAMAVIVVVAAWSVVVYFIWKVYSERYHKHSIRNHDRKMAQQTEAYRISYMQEHELEPPSPTTAPQVNLLDDKTFMDALAVKLGQIGGQPDTNRRTNGGGQPTDTVDAETDKEAVKRELLALHQSKPDASYAQLGNWMKKPLDRRRVSELVSEMKQERVRW
jgi:ABC-type nickel/cobalt efflux system permease component RcnA